jgi:ABC-type Fe3+ transport system permease subunit
MNDPDLWKNALILGPIGLLLALGFGLTLRSGVANMRSTRGWRQSLENLSRTVLLLAGCLIGLAVIQQVVGFKLGLL